MEDFAFCVNSCDQDEISFKVCPFTLWNGRKGRDCIFESLDRIFSNDDFKNWFSTLKVEHLPRTGSDQALFSLIIQKGSHQSIKPFKFLAFWVEENSFKDIVRKH